MKNNLKYFTLDSFGPRPAPENWLEIISHLNVLVDQFGVPDDQEELSLFWNAYWNHKPYHGKSIPFVAPVWEDWPGIPVCRAERPGFQAPASVYFNPKDRRIFWSNGDAIETDPIETLEQAEIHCKAIFPDCTLCNEGERMTNMFGKEEKKTYRVMDEYVESWTNEVIPEEGLIVDREEIERLAEAWETTVEELMKQVEEI